MANGGWGLCLHIAWRWANERTLPDWVYRALAEDRDDFFSCLDIAYTLDLAKDEAE